MQIKRKPQNSKVKYLRTEMVRIDDLVLYPGNPRRSELEPLAESLKENGQFSPVVVQDSTKQLIIGNHRTKAAKKLLGWTEVRAEFVECSDARAAKVVIADNKLGERGDYDENALAKILYAVDDPTVGTGYSVGEVESITSLLDSKQAELSETVGNYTVAPTAQYEELGGQAPLHNEDDSLDKADSVLPGTFQLTDEASFDGWGRWEIPRLRPDMLMGVDEWPNDISVWAGGASRDTPENDDPDHWWLYIYGISSTSGMKHKDKMILSFYTFDDYFEKWFWEPAKYTTRALNTGVKYAMSPNYSTWSNQPMFESLQALYKNRWMGRYFQEAGIKLLPNLEWPLGEGKYEEFLTNYVLKSLPKNLPMISLQGNSVIGREDKATRDANKLIVARQYRQVVDTLHPNTLIYYGRPEWIEFVDRLNLDCNVIGISNHRTELNKSYIGRTRKTEL